MEKLWFEQNIIIPEEQFIHNNALICTTCYKTLKVLPPDIVITTRYTAVDTDGSIYPDINHDMIYDEYVKGATKHNEVCDGVNTMVSEYSHIGCLPNVSMKCPNCKDGEMVNVDGNMIDYLMEIWDFGIETSDSCWGEIDHTSMSMPYIFMRHTFDINNLLELLESTEDHVVRDLGVSEYSQDFETVSDAYVITFKVLSLGYKFSISWHEDRMAMYIDIETESDYEDRDGKFKYLVWLLCHYMRPHPLGKFDWDFVVNYDPDDYDDVPTATDEEKELVLEVLYPTIDMNVSEQAKMNTSIN